MDAFFSRDWFGTISLLGAVQGLFLATLLVSKRRNSTANKVLAVAMLAFSLDLATAAYYANGLETTFPHFIGLDYLLPLLYGPVIFLYAKTLSEGRQHVDKQQLLHFLPLLLVALCLVPFYLQSGAEKLAFRRAPEQHAWTLPLVFLNHVKLFYGLLYIGLTFRLLKRHRARVKSLFSSVEHINLAWLQKLLVGGLIVWGIALLFHLLWMQAGIAQGIDPIEGYSLYVSLAVAVLVYAIGYLGLRQPEIFAPSRPQPALAPLSPARNGRHVPPRGESAAPPQGPVEERDPLLSRPRYVRSGMDPETARQHVARLVALMERDRLYRNSDLTLQDLADALAISSHNLSEVINTQLGQSFYDFVNGYRVQEVQQQLADPDNAHLTVLSIGLDAGFNSKSSFNAVFKKHTKMTPSQYREHVLQDA